MKMDTDKMSGTILLAIFFGLLILPTYLQNHIFIPGGILVAGAGHSGVLFLAPVLVFALYLLGSLVVAGIVAQRRGNRLTSMPNFFTGRRGRWTAAVLAGCVTMAVYGLPDYWYATESQLTFHPGWLSASAAYEWSDITRVRIACYMRGRRQAAYIVHTRDGRSANLADSRADFVRNFRRLAELSPSATYEVSDVEHCPDFMRTFVRRVSQTEE